MNDIPVALSNMRTELETDLPRTLRKKAQQGGKNQIKICANHSAMLPRVGRESSLSPLRQSNQCPARTNVAP